ncbi:hypothetical protein Bca4012_077092 [Brassica carinata]
MLGLVEAGVCDLSLVVCSWGKRLGSSRRAVFGWAIIFKSGSSGRPKLPGSDSRLNLVHSSAASGWF